MVRVRDIARIKCSKRTYGVHPDQQNFYSKREENPTRPGRDVDAIEESDNHDSSDSHSLRDEVSIAWRLNNNFTYC